MKSNCSPKISQRVLGGWFSTQPRGGVPKMSEYVGYQYHESKDEQKESHKLSVIEIKEVQAMAP